MRTHMRTRTHTHTHACPRLQFRGGSGPPQSACSVWSAQRNSVPVSSCLSLLTTRELGVTTSTCRCGQQPQEGCVACPRSAAVSGWARIPPWSWSTGTRVAVSAQRPCCSAQRAEEMTLGVCLTLEPQGGAGEPGARQLARSSPLVLAHALEKKLVLPGSCWTGRAMEPLPLLATSLVLSLTGSGTPPSLHLLISSGTLFQPPRWCGHEASKQRLAQTGCLGATHCYCPGSQCCTQTSLPKCKVVS